MWLAHRCSGEFGFFDCSSSFVTVGVGGREPKERILRFAAQLCTTKGAAWSIMQATNGRISEGAAPFSLRVY
jgi:hypothetical protein